MTDDQFNKLCDLLTRRAPMSNWLMQVGVGVCVAGIAFVASQGKVMSDKLTELSVRYENIETNNKYLMGFAQQPRFTQDMFDRQIQALSEQIDLNRRRIERLEEGRKP